MSIQELAEEFKKQLPSALFSRYEMEQFEKRAWAVYFTPSEWREIIATLEASSDPESIVDELETEIKREIGKGEAFLAEGPYKQASLMTLKFILTRIEALKESVKT